METGRIALRPVFTLRFRYDLVAMPAAEAIVVATGKGFASLVAPGVSAGTVESMTDDIFVNPVVIVAHHAISIPAVIPLVGLRVGCARETQSSTQYDRS